MKKLTFKKQLLLGLFISLFIGKQNWVLSQGQGQGNQQWKINGNISDSLHYMGTKNNFPLKLRTNDFERLRITSEGLVGIGTTSPQEKLDVNGNVIFRGNVKLPNLPENNGLTNREVVFVNENGKLSRGGGSNLASLLYNPLLACKNDVDGNVPNPLWANGINKIYTDCNLINVGINTDAPRVKLDVRGTAYARQLSLGNTDPTLTAGRFFSLKTFSSTAGNQKIFQIENNTEEIFSISNQGAIASKTISNFGSFTNVGQFTSSGNFTNNGNVLVNGEILADGNLGANGTLVIGGTTQFHDEVYAKKLFKLHRYESNTSEPLMIIENNIGKLMQVDNNGLLKARRIIVNQETWADYVFEKTYKLKPIKEVAQFINEQKHLPDVPSKNEVLENGVDLGKMDAILLQKIEELTLYLIEQNELLEKQGLEIELLKNKLK